MPCSATKRAALAVTGMKNWRIKTMLISRVLNKAKCIRRKMAKTKDYPYPASRTTTDESDYQFQSRRDSIGRGYNRNGVEL